MKLRFSTLFYSQTDGKTKHVNGDLNQYLKNLVSVDQADWADYVGRAEFSCNVVIALHLATKGSSFVMVYKVDAFQPINLAFKGAHRSLEFNQDGENLARKHKQVYEMTNLLVKKARELYYKEQVNAGRCEVEYDVGQNSILECEQLYLAHKASLQNLCHKLELRF